MATTYARMISAEMHMFTIAVMYAAVAIPLSGWAGLWSVIFLADIATSNAGIDNNSPPQAKEAIAKTKASMALVWGLSLIHISEPTRPY